MINFANPLFLYLLPLAALLIAAGAFIRIKFRPALKYPLAAEVKPQAQSYIANWAAYALTAAALLLLLVALARPREEGKTILPPQEGIDIMLTIDISNSMDALDFTPNRLGAAKNTAIDFIKQRISDRIGVVVFDENALLQSPLTLDYFALQEFIGNIYLGMTGGRGGTAVGDAIARSTEHLKNSPAKSKVMILLTDGESNSGTIDPLAAAKAAQAYGIKIYAVAMSDEGLIARPSSGFFGAATALTNQSITAEGQALLMEIAKMTGADFYRAKNNLELQEIYGVINALEKTEFKETSQINYKDRYMPFLIAALLLLLAAFVLDKFIFIKVP